MQKIRELLIGSKVVNFDETGVIVEVSTQWVHNSSNEKYTYLTVNKKRGQVGIADNGVITNFTGTQFMTAGDHIGDLKTSVMLYAVLICYER